MTSTARGHSRPPRNDHDHGDRSPATPGFASLGVPPDLIEVLAGVGVQSPFPIQSATIPDAMDGLDVRGKAQTGSGKTLAFGLPLVERTRPARPRRPHSLVLVPTRELANQVADELAPLAAARGLWVTTIYGGVSMQRQVKALRAGVDIVVATPGRLNDLLEQRELSVAQVAFVVIDEADQMADMGFLPQVERILGQIEGRPQTLLFSATLDGAVGALARRYQRDAVEHDVVAAPDEALQLEERFIGVRSDERVAVCAQVCAGARRALVFVSTTFGADRLVTQLGREGLRAGAIHGRLSQNKRERTLAAFAAGSISVLVATNVAARGIHVDSVEAVVHFDPPEDHKVYVHRSGRTARAGEQGLVVTLVQPEHVLDLSRLQREAGVDHAIVSMRPGDARLLDLGAWEPPRGAEVVTGAYSMTARRKAAGRGAPAPAASMSGRPRRDRRAGAATRDRRRR